MPITTPQCSLHLAGPFNILSYGENTYKGQAHRMFTHAEENAINKLLPMPRRRHLKRVDMLVIRVSKTGIIGCSKPCEHCLQEMSMKLPNKGYYIGKIYYSDKEGEISVDSLLNIWGADEGRHISQFYRNKNRS